ncbi:MAG TPA: hypothetical protein VNK95_22355, partial [Caldilineaceae bacterium]|nr:hypothetical protein [Caldilineaceae bacterium]
IPFADIVREFPSSYRDAVPCRWAHWFNVRQGHLFLWLPLRLNQWISPWSPRLFSSCARDTFAYTPPVFRSAVSGLWFFVGGTVHATAKITTT